MQYRIPILMFMSALFQVATALQGPILAVFVLNMGGNMASLGKVMGVYSIVYTTVSVFIASKMIAYRKILLNVCYLGYALYSFLMYSSPSVEYIYVLQVLSGVVAAFGKPSFNETLIVNSARVNYTKNYAWIVFFGGVFGTIASFCSGYLAHYGHMNEVFLIMMGFAFAAFFVSLIIHRWSPPTDIDGVS